MQKGSEGLTAEEAELIEENDQIVQDLRSVSQDGRYFCDTCFQLPECQKSQVSLSCQATDCSGSQTSLLSS